jgi:alpha-galactosidase
MYPSYSLRYSLMICLALWCMAISAQKYPGLAPTPPMGWNSWNYYNCDISEAKIRQMADAMAANGMKEAGYQYIVIDDCWQLSRDKDGYIIADAQKFPSGIKALADYIHAKGLKFGIYSCAGRLTCQKRPGGAGFEDKDARRYAEWGVDYLKYDWCNSEGMSSTVQYSTMRDALHKAGRPIVFSLCEWGSTRPWLWADTVGQLWRTTGDIQDKFDRGHGVLKIFDEQARIRRYNQPDGWNDPDMLEVGNKGLSYTESRTHFTLWCMMAAPLIAGNDLHAMDRDILAVLTDRNAIAVDQDKLGIQCFLWYKAGGIEAWIKPLADGDYAVCFLNRGGKAVQVDHECRGPVTDPDFGRTYTIDSSYRVLDIWANRDLGTTARKITATVKGHDVLFVLLRKKL